jgi:hypothetical protein
MIAESPNTFINVIKNCIFLLVLIAAWLLTHPYYGIWHDSILYTGQALLKIYPEIYSKDLFFAYGSQESFTIFSKIYAVFIQFFGIANAAKILLIIGHAIWLLGCILLARLLGYPKAWFFLIVLIAMPGFYGHAYIFSYGEPFLTARTFGEAFTLLGIGVFFHQNYVLGFFFLICALLVHPLIAMPGFFFLLLVILWGRWFWLIAALLIGISGLLLLAWLGVEPASRLFRVMNDEWYVVALHRNNYVFLVNWELDEILTSIFFACVLLHAAKLTQDNRLRQIFQSIFLVGLAGIAVSLIGGDCLHSALIIQLQLWRSLWLVQVFAWMAWVVLCVELWKTQNWVYLLNYLLAWCLFDGIGGSIALLVLYTFHLSQTGKINRTLCNGLLGVCFVIGSIGLVAEGGFFLIKARLFGFNTEYYFNRLYPILTSLLLLFFFFLTYKILHQTDRVRILLAILFVMLPLLAGFIYWDRRAIWNMYLEGDYRINNPPLFKHELPQDATVYWYERPQDEFYFSQMLRKQANKTNFYWQELPHIWQELPHIKFYLNNNLKQVWLLLKRKSYVSRLQGAGALFSMNTAIEYKYRMKKIKQLGAIEAFDNIDEYRGELSEEQQRQGLIYVCADNQLDYVVLNTKLPGVLECSTSNLIDRQFCLYDCAMLRNQTSQFNPNN